MSLKLRWADLGEMFDGPHATPTRRAEGPYFLNIASLKSGRLDLAASDHVAPDDFVKWTKRVTPRAGDLLFSYETRLGEAALMPEGVEACLGRRMALLRPDLAIVNPKFLLYFYLSPMFQRTIAERTIHGATVPRILLSDMPSWQVEMPPLDEQRAIAEVLGALDDKIGANTRQAATARELMVALASSAQEHCELRQLVARTTSTVKPEELGDMTVDHFSLPAFDAAEGPERVQAGVIKSNKTAIDHPCVLLSKLNPRIPRAWDVVTVSGRPSLASTEFLVLEPQGFSSSVLWAVLSQPRFWSELSGMVAGTSGSHQRVRPDDVLAVEVIDPRTISEPVRGSITALGERVAHVDVENVSLATTRDALLPLLMSGTVTVKDAESVVEGVV